jgi:hypothetical protein
MSVIAQSRPLTTGDELGANDRNFPWRVDPEPHLPSLHPHDRHANVVADVELFHELTGQHEHVMRPIGNSQ